MKYFIITYGCQMNISDSEKIAVLLQHQGYKPAKTEDRANLIVLNCCSVRQAAMHRVYDKISRYYGKKKIVLAGCVLEKDKNALKEKVAEIWHPDEYFNCSNLAVDRSRSSADKMIFYVPIMTGCNNFCSYCAVPFTRGREKSRPAEEIIAEAKALIKNGVKEIMLLGQNVNSYQFKNQKSKIKITSQNSKLEKEKYCHSECNEESPAYAGRLIYFPQLLQSINALPGNFRLSFMTSHPKDMSDELIKTIAKCEKLVKELHLPIQSGDNTILRKMNRRYTTKHYLGLLKKIRQAIPDIKITTDIIVGFPGETKKQFENTVKLCKAAKFNGAFIAKYSPRPGTAAAKLKDDVPISEKKRRWRILDTLINKFEH